MLFSLSESWIHYNFHYNYNDPRQLFKCVKDSCILCLKLTKINKFFGNKVFNVDHHLISTILVWTKITELRDQCVLKIDLRTTILSRDNCWLRFQPIFPNKFVQIHFFPSNYFFYWCKLSTFAKETYLLFCRWCQLTG